MGRPSGRWYCRLMEDKTVRMTGRWSCSNGLREVAWVAVTAGWLLAASQPSWAADMVPSPPPDVREDSGTTPPVMPLPPPPGVRPEMRSHPQTIPNPKASVPPDQPVPELPFDETLSQKNAPPPTVPPARPIPDPPHAPAASP